MKKILLTLCAVLTVSALAACSHSDNAAAAGNKKELILGSSPMPYAVVFEKGVAPILEKQGYTIKVVNFSNLDSNNAAVEEGSVDFNLDQHTAYINTYNKNRATHLYPLVHIPVVPAAMYSDKYKSFADAPDGATVLIPNDASNTARALRVLVKAGLIKLSDKADPVLATTHDIVENPRHLKITELDSAIIPRTLPDVDFGFASGGIAYQSKMDPKKIVLREDVLPEMEMVVAVNEKNKDTQWAKDVKAAYESQAFKDFMKTYNSDNMWVMPAQ